MDAWIKIYFTQVSGRFHLPARKVSDRGAEPRQIQRQSRGGGDKRSGGRKEREKRIVNQAGAIKIHELEAGSDLCI